MSAMTTRPPAATIISAVAAPRPDAPPLTRTVRPSNCIVRFYRGAYSRKAGDLSTTGLNDPNVPNDPNDLYDVLVHDLGDFLFLLLSTAKSLDLQRRLLLEHFLSIEPFHVLMVALFLGRYLLTRTQLLFPCVLGDAELVEVGLLALGDGVRIEHQ